MAAVLSCLWCPLLCPGFDVFFTEVFRTNADGSREWESDGGVAVYTSSINDTICPCPLPPPPEPFPFHPFQK